MIESEIGHIKQRHKHRSTQELREILASNDMNHYHHEVIEAMSQVIEDRMKCLRTCRTFHSCKSRHAALFGEHALPLCKDPKPILLG